MAQRGRKPKPIALKILEGVRSDRINVDEPKFPPATTDPPAFLEGHALEHWRELAPILVGAGVMLQGDRSALALLCTLYDRWRTHRDDNQAIGAYMRMLCEFGLTPSSRSRLRALPEKPKDELAAFLGERKAP